MGKNKKHIKKYSCAICENEWSPAFIKKFKISKMEFVNNNRKKFSFQCPICKVWLNGILCPNCRKCVPPYIKCPECGVSLETPFTGCRRYL